MKKLLFVLLLCFPLVAQQPPAVSIPIKNPSFEPSVPLVGYPFDPCGIRGYVPEWHWGNGTGVLQPYSINSCHFAPVPSGTTFAVAGGGGSHFSQDLGVRPAMGVYTLKFSVANYFPSYPGYYEAKISYGTQELCEASGWARRNFEQITLVCPSPNYLIIDKSQPDAGPAQGASNLVITFTGETWTVLFDDVSLTFTAEPE